MRALCYIWCGLAVVFSPGARAAEPAETVRAAFQDFLRQPNYTWTTYDRDAPVEGRHEKGGYTQIGFRSGPHLPSGESPAAEPALGFTNSEKPVSANWIFWTPDGWRKLKNLAPPEMRSSRGDSSRAGSGGRQFGLQRPDHEIAILLANLQEVSLERAGVFKATLTTKGAIDLLGHNSGPNGRGPRVTEAKGDVIVEVRNGQLVRCEISCQAVLVFTTGSRALAANRVREFRDFGTTEVVVPAEVRRLFGEKIPRAAAKQP